MSADRIRSTDAMAALLYDVMRDHLPTGTVEKVVRDLEACHAAALASGSPSMTYVFSNRHLASYALELSERIRACCDPTPEDPAGR